MHPGASSLLTKVHKLLDTTLLDRCDKIKVLFRVQLLDYENTKKVSECYEFDYDEQVRESAPATE
jgi:hypothetical protein